MTRRIERDTIYRGRRFSAETIELCVRWYITYRLSYRDLAAMMAEREIVVSHLAAICICSSCQRAVDTGAIATVMAESERRLLLASTRMYQ
jgi:hypothetical protein